MVNCRQQTGDEIMKEKQQGKFCSFPFFVVVVGLFVNFHVGLLTACSCNKRGLVINV